MVPGERLLQTPSGRLPNCRVLPWTGGFSMGSPSGALRGACLLLPSPSISLAPAPWAPMPRWGSPER